MLRDMYVTPSNLVCLGHAAINAGSITQFDTSTVPDGTESILIQAKGVSLFWSDSPGNPSSTSDMMEVTSGSVMLFAGAMHKLRYQGTALFQYYGKRGNV